MRSFRSPLAFIILLAGCGSPAPPKAVPSSGVDDPIAETNNATVVDDDPIDDPDPIDVPVDPEPPVTVECVSELVSGNGSYYALAAEVGPAETLVTMAYHLAATPTSDPEEEAIWGGAVNAEFTPRLFAFEQDQNFLDVTKSENDGIYRGTMSGSTQFGGAVQVSCWPTALEHPARYDEATGNCLDALGNEARNDIPWMVAVRTGFGQCARFEGELTGEAFDYPTFDFIDLRGADFNSAQLHFAYLQDVQLEGADLRQFDFGYATVSGTIDANTRLPELAECETAAGATTFSCTR